jgi:hypothetical protein
MTTVLATSAWTTSAADAATRAVGGRCHEAPGRRLVVLTVPAIAGFTFDLAGRHYRTDTAGAVRLDPVTCGDYAGALRPTTRVIDQGRHRTAIFDGWFGQRLLGQRRADGTIYAAFRQRALVSFRLVDRQGAPITRSDVGAIVIRSSSGGLVRLGSDRSTAVLDSTRIIGFANRVISRNILWSVQRVDVDGNSPVTRGGVRFQPQTRSVVTVPLSLYPLRIVVRDAILGLPVGRTVSVVAPNGTVRKVVLDAKATGEVPALASGRYILRAGGGSVAVSFRQPVGMSRPQVAEMTVLSYSDVAIAGTALLVLAVGLVLLGRHLRQPARSPSAGWVTDDGATRPRTAAVAPMPPVSTGAPPGPTEA